MVRKKRKGLHTQVKSKIASYIDSHITSNRYLMEYLLLCLYVYVALDFLILMWFTLAPYMVQADGGILFGLGMFAYNFGYLLSNCHQMPERSIIIHKVIYPFCARDLGIYVGCLAGGVLPLVKFRKPRWLASFTVLVLLMVPLVVDGVSQTILSLRESNNTLRLLTGFLFGFGMIYLFAEKIIEHNLGYDRGKYIYAGLKIFLLSLALLLAASYSISNNYITAKSAVKESGLNPSFVTYIPQRSLQTIRSDPYVGAYDDLILDAVYRHGHRGYGVWAIYDGEMEYSGKFVYFSKGNGTLKLVPDVSSI